MGSSLLRYLKMKIHSDIYNREWASITIKGSHLRSTPGRISTNEKTGKLFNWQRPTTVFGSRQDIELHCFPGREYAYHYASIVATYLSLQGRDPSVVSYIEPSPEDCIVPILTSNLQKLGPVDVVVLGYVHGLTGLTGPGHWEYGDAHNELFAWKTQRMPNGANVAFLGCRVSFWGDIAGNLVRALQQLCQVKYVLYIGKLGSLKSEHIPNSVLATGNTTSVNGANVEWHNPLADILNEDPCVIQGRHKTLPSVLDETKKWLADHIGEFDWVDPEIGHMALASIAGGTEFGYLHIVSDNLAKKFCYDLSNERLHQVLDDRKAIVTKIESRLETFFQKRYK
ncbi:hypothetical protein H4I96_12087 [Botrytis cinerea]